MNSGRVPGEPKQPWQERLHDASARVEEDLRNVISYINDEVVPDVRRHGSARGGGGGAAAMAANSCRAHSVLPCSSS